MKKSTDDDDVEREALKKDIGEKIRQLRQILGLTQAQAAKIVGVHAKYFSKYESGERTISQDRLERLSAYADDRFLIDLPLDSPSPSDVSGARACAGMTQQEVADFLGVHLDTVQSWEYGRAKMPPVRWVKLEEIVKKK